ncbi:putative autotransporter adhesin-like protein [Hydrogenispora ethanolica]|uniref:Putative autotransporter adhesin-like protein n=2 Tax=Hydrogenispora ethanolica TaxID=1082276 RepID=A0A4R1RQD6_HYDET|nr:putative autotransporter adhesin-like protein [Hydrogenispora ethanolica]
MQGMKNGFLTILIIFLIAMSYLQTAPAGELPDVSAWFRHVQGSGKIVQEQRNVPELAGVQLDGGGTLYLRQGEKQRVEVATDDNLLSLLRTRVDGDGVLHVGFEAGSVNPTQLEIFVTARQIRSLKIAGSGKVLGQGKIGGEDLKLIIAGSGNMALDLDLKQLDSDISGSGNLALSGRADTQRVRISGSGSVNALELESQSAKIDVSGSGDCNVRVRDELQAHISGSGKVQYQGQPRLDTHVSGSGKILSIP